MGEKKVVSRSIAVVLAFLCFLLLGATIGAVIYSNNAYSAYNNYTLTHSHADAEYGSLASELARTNENISSLSSQLSTLQGELASNNTQLTNLHSQIDDLSSKLLSLNKTFGTTTDYYNSLMYVYTTENHDLSVQLTDANSQIFTLQNQVDSLNSIANLTASTTWVNNQTVSQSAGSYTVWSQSAGYSGYISITISSATSAFSNVTYSTYGVNYNVQTNVGTNGTAYFPVLPTSNVTIAVGNGLSSGNATQTVTIKYYY